MVAQFGGAQPPRSDEGSGRHAQTPLQWVNYTARGFHNKRNKQSFINAIYFHCGGLDLAKRART